jgi:glycosyltransferase involved in cell wall biosynthesis
MGVFGAGVRYEPARRWRALLPVRGVDVWHTPHQDASFRPARRSRVVLTLLDLNFLERHDYSERKKARRLAAVQKKVNRAAAIATISEYTATVVRQRLDIPDIPFRVVYLGNPLAAVGAATPPAANSLLGSLTSSAPFFLFVGVLHPKKNLHTLLAALPALPNYRLVLAGSNNHPYATQLRQQAKNLGVADRVLMPGPVDDSTKRWLYERSQGLLFPSLSEGFGLPVVEAMSCGKPVFLSRLTSLPEIGGDDAYYFDSFAPDDMAETIRAGLSDFSASPLRARRLRERAERFSWARAAAEYWSLYVAVAASTGLR